jgi:carbon monoxide dehydrogenase subunit G
VELKGERQLPADQQAAWAALTDVEMLKLCIPGCESITAVDSNRYEIAMTAAIGPVKSKFKGTLEMADIDAPNSYTLKFDGSGGAAGFARGSAHVNLTPQGAQQTQLAYLANAQVGGKLAQVGSRLIDAAAGATADKFFEAFAAQLQARQAIAAAQGVGAPIPAAPPPAAFGFWSLLKAFLKRLFGRAG